MIQYGNNCRYITQAEQPVISKCYRCGKKKQVNEFTLASIYSKRVLMCKECAALITSEQKHKQPSKL